MRTTSVLTAEIELEHVSGNAYHPSSPRFAELRNTAHITILTACEEGTIYLTKAYGEEFTEHWYHVDDLDDADIARAISVYNFRLVA